MLNEFKNFITEEGLITPKNRILLAVSGGIDSIVLAELFQRAEINFGIAHCNFGLRNKESDEDELFVENLAEKLGAPYHCIRFDTNSYAKKNQLSIQEAARELRYKWFEEIRSLHKYHFIATAHHADDSIETFLINLIRGTGISGLHGILPKQNKIIRPLLFANKKKIKEFTKKSKLKFREDSSNSTDKYLRNRIRQNLMPVLKELNPEIETALTKDIKYLREAEIIYLSAIKRKTKTLLSIKDDDVLISINKLQELNPVSTYAHEILKPYGFTSATINKIVDTLNGIPGKTFLSENYRLIKDRNFLILSRKNIPQEKLKIRIKKNTESTQIGKFELTFKIKPTGTKFSRHPNTATLDFNKLEFPLTIRKWQMGDTFQPLGMKGKKKLSDFFTDQKFSLSDKEKTMLLISGNEIVWVIGHRIDDRFKVTENTKKIYFAELSE